MTDKSKNDGDFAPSKQPFGADLEDKSLESEADEAKDAGDVPTGDPGLTPAPAPGAPSDAESVEEADNKIEVEFVHHAQLPDDDGKLEDLVPGDKRTLTADLANSLVHAHRAKRTSNDA